MLTDFYRAIIVINRRFHNFSLKIKDLTKIINRKGQDHR